MAFSAVQVVEFTVARNMFLIYSGESRKSCDRAASASFVVVSLMAHSFKLSAFGRVESWARRLCRTCIYVRVTVTSKLWAADSNALASQRLYSLRRPGCAWSSATVAAMSDRKSCVAVVGCKTRAHRFN